MLFTLSSKNIHRHKERAPRCSEEMTSGSHMSACIVGIHYTPHLSHYWHQTGEGESWGDLFFITDVFRLFSVTHQLSSQSSIAR